VTENEPKYGPGSRVKSQFDATLVAKALPKLGRYIQRVIANPKRYVGAALLPYCQDAKKLCDLIGMKSADWDVLILIASAFYSLGYERGKRDAKRQP